jgi:hypothetical protein
MALGAASAQATLYGVAHQIAEGRESLVRVSVADAAITDNAQVALANCCRVSGAAGVDDDADCYFITRMMILRWLGSFIASALPAALPPPSTTRRKTACIAVDHHATTLALSDNGSGLRLVSISDAEPSVRWRSHPHQLLRAQWRCVVHRQCIAFVARLPRRPVIRRHA